VNLPTLYTPGRM